MIETPVLISGGGAVGLTLALALSRRGVRCLLVDERPRNALQVAPLGDLADPLKVVLDDPSIDARLSWRLFGFERFPDHVIAHILEVGGEAQQQVRARFLVGCDGAESRVRQFLDIDLDAVDGQARPGVRIARSYGRGHVLLAGEAAHPLCPDGLGLGVADAISAADKLAAWLAAPGGADVLCEYEIERRPAELEATGQ